MLREIDLELVNLRREEANACMHYSLYHAATLTAGSGVELLLEFLVGELIDAHMVDQPQRADQLRNNLEGKIYERGEIEKWGLGVWCDFYSEFQIPFELWEMFDYQSRSYAEEKLRKVNKEWNRCKHGIHEALPDTAREIVVYLNELLDEIGISSSRHSGKINWRKSWGDRINYWTVQNRGKPETVLLLSLLPMLGVVERLISDKRVGYEHKTRLMVAENYVFSTVDLVKEDNRQPKSLVDDAAVLVLTLHWLLHKAELDKEILQDCWQQEKSAVNEIERLYKFIFENHVKLFPDSPSQIGKYLVWAAIRRIADVGPEALWQNYWKEVY